MDKYYLITGYLSGASGMNTLTYNQVLSSSNLSLSEIPKNHISFAIPRIDWVKGKQFDPYTEEDNANSYAVYNNNVYLCISNNTNNVDKLVNSSNYSPTHTTGLVRYLDGYLWLFLYQISSSVSDLANINFIPAPSSRALKDLIINQEVDTITCSEPGGTGFCAQFLATPGASYANLIFTGSTLCSSCSDVAEETTKTDLLWTKFYPTGETVPLSISLFNYTESLENAIAAGKINSKLNFEAKTYENAKLSGLDDGCLLGARINLSAISLQETLDSVAPNTYLNVLSTEKTIGFSGGNGSDATIEFITTVVNSTYDRIVGIRLLTHGSSYLPESVTLTFPGMTLSTKQQALRLNIDLLGTPPSLIFPTINSIFNVASYDSIGENRVVNIVNASPDAAIVANYYAIVKADPTLATIAEICPAKLPIRPFIPQGTSGKETRSLNFVQNVTTTEVNKR